MLHLVYLLHLMPVSGAAPFQLCCEDLAGLPSTPPPSRASASLAVPHLRQATGHVTQRSGFVHRLCEHVTCFMPAQIGICRPPGS